MSNHSHISIPCTLADLDEDISVTKPNCFLIHPHSRIKLSNSEIRDTKDTLNYETTDRVLKDQINTGGSENYKLIPPRSSTAPFYMNLDQEPKRTMPSLDTFSAQNNRLWRRKTNLEKLNTTKGESFSENIDELEILKRGISEPGVKREQNLNVLADMGLPEGISENSVLSPVFPNNPNNGKSVRSIDLDLADKPLSFISDYTVYQKQNLEVQKILQKQTSPLTELPSPSDHEQKKPSKSSKNKNGHIRKAVKKIHNIFCCGFLKRKGTKKSLWQRLKEPLLPESRLRLAWDIIITLVILVLLITLPLYLSFLSLNNAVIALIVCDVFLFLDIFFRFWSAYYDKNGILITDRKQIACHYAKTWLIIDIIIAFPFYAFYDNSDLTDDEIANTDKPLLLRLLLVLKLLKLLKLLEIVSVFRKMQIYFSSSSITSGFFHLIKLMLVVIIFNHWIGCAWHFVALKEIERGETNTWLNVKGLVGEPTATVYAYSLYWASTTMLTIGYGDIVPTTTAEVVFTIFVEFIGCVLFAYTLDGVRGIIYRFNRDREDLSSSIYEASKFIKENKLSQDVEDRIKGYTVHLVEGKVQKKGFKENFLSQLPDDLRRDILSDLHGDSLVQNVSFNSNFGMKFIKQVSLRIREKTFSQNEVVYSEGSNDGSFYTVTKGELGIFVHGEKFPIKKLTVGDYCGEISFFSGKKRTETIKSIGYSQVFCLEESVFLTMLEQDEDEKEIYHEIRDKINLENDYSPLKLTCLACGLIFHPLQACPHLHYLPNLTVILNTKAKEESSFMKEFERRPRKRFHALSFKKNLAKISNRLAKINRVDSDKIQIIVQDDKEEINIASRKDLSDKNYGDKDSIAISDLTEEKLMNLLILIKKKSKENESVDQVKTFKNYFKHNNPENTIKRLNTLNKLGYLNPFSSTELSKKIKNPAGQLQRDKPVFLNRENSM